MTNRKLTSIIICSAIALLSLVYIQIKWMQNSRNLIEEQFDQKVELALCMAISNIASDNQNTQPVKQTCSAPGQGNMNCCRADLAQLADQPSFKDIVSDALHYYNIDMPFELDISQANLFLMPEIQNNSNSCSLAPVTNSNDYRLNIEFPGKQNYIMKKMSLLILLSVIILLAVVALFIYANYELVKQQRLRKRNKAFFNQMAHEFKTPLTNIGLAAKMLSKKTPDHLLDIIDQENEQLKKHVDQVLTLASLDTNEYDLNPSPTNIGRFLKKISDQLMVPVQEKGGSLTINYAEVPKVNIDAYHLGNIMRNLIDNALKYNDKKPEININVTTNENSVIIQVEDNGIGILPKDQEWVFDQYFRVKNGDIYESKGFGIGLAYVKKIVEMHHGKVHVISEEGLGSRFDLSFPKMSINAA